MSQKKTKPSNQNTSGEGKLQTTVKVVTAVVTIGAAIVEAINVFGSKKS